MKFARRTAAANERVSLYGGFSGSGSSRDELLAAVDVVRRLSRNAMVITFDLKSLHLRGARHACPS
jgi:hypothetical protein